MNRSRERSHIATHTVAGFAVTKCGLRVLPDRVVASGASCRNCTRVGIPKPKRYRGCKEGAKTHKGRLWVCRSCEKEACAECAHHYGRSRDPETRTFSCSACARTKPPPRWPGSLGL